MKKQAGSNECMCVCVGVCFCYLLGNLSWINADSAWPTSPRGDQTQKLMQQNRISDILLDLVTLGHNQMWKSIQFHATDGFGGLLD